MPPIRDLLNRFRPAGTPGAASAAAVPADRVAEQTAELAPVFALLADVQAEAQRIRDAAVSAAERHRWQANEAADRIVAEARERADAVRAAAFTAARTVAEEAGCRLVERARLDADALRRRAEQRLPEHVAQVVDIAIRESGRHRDTAEPDGRR